MEYSLSIVKNNKIYISGNLVSRDGLFQEKNYDVYPRYISMSPVAIFVIDVDGDLWETRYHTSEKLEKINLDCKVVSVSVNEGNVVLLDIDGNIWTSINYSLDFKKEPEVARFVQISCGIGSYIAIDIDGNIWIKMLNGVLTQLTKEIVFIAISYMKYFAAIDANGDLYLGYLRGEMNLSLEKVDFKNIKFKAVGVGIFHMVLIDTDDNIWYYGYGNFTVLNYGLKANTVSAGKYTTMIQSNENELYIVGSNIDNMMGLRTGATGFLNKIDYVGEIDFLPNVSHNKKFYRTKSARN
jgi:hypothetical protein